MVLVGLFSRPMYIDLYLERAVSPFDFKRTTDRHAYGFLVFVPLCQHRLTGHDRLLPNLCQPTIYERLFIYSVCK